jgi:hypothetical protein
MEIQPCDYSVISMQRGSSFAPYLTKSGQPLSLVYPGLLTAKQMFKYEQTNNSHLTWVLRFVGFFFMFIGMLALFNPLVALSEMVPFLGELVGLGVAAAAFLGSLALSLIVVAVSWFVVRPIFGISLIIIAILFGIVLPMKLKQSRTVVAAS